MSIFRYPLGFFLLLGVAAHASVLWGHFSAMWDSNSFRFFPLAIALAAFVAYQRLGRLVPLNPDADSDADKVGFSGQREVKPAQSLFVIVGMILSVAGALVTSVLSTPTLGWMSFLFFLVVLIYAGHGKQGIKAMWPALVLLAMVRFVPDAFEVSLGLSLQKVATLLASVLLDAFGWVNIREGAMLSLASSSFEPFEACSGIRSLFSSLTVIFAWGILKNYGWVRHLFNLIQTFFWVLVFNALRVMLVLLFQSRGWTSFTQGLPLEILTTAFFLVIVGITLSTDQLITAFTLKEDPVDLGTGDGSATSPVSAPAWNWTAGNSLAFAWMIGLGIASLVAMRMLVATASIASDPVRFPVPAKDLLGQQVDGWAVTNFSHIERFNKHLLGKDTYQWTLRKGKKQALLALDQSIMSCENPQLHFSSLGWTCSSIEAGKTSSVQDPKLVEPVGQEGNTETLPGLPTEISGPTEQPALGAYEQVALSKKSGESGVVMFAKLGVGGDALSTSEPRDLFSTEFWSRRLSAGLATLLGNTNAAKGLLAASQNPSQTLRLTWIPNVESTPEDLGELRKLLSASQDALKKSSLFESSK
jgi:exosortase/archaeosortase family protein